MHRPPRIFAAIVLLVAIAFLYGGVRLLAVGGSLYYVLAGIALLASAILLWRGNKLGSRIYGALLVATLLWSLFEVGTDLWALAPRLGFLSVLGAWLLTPFARRGLYSPQPPPALLGSARSRSVAAASALAVVAIFIVGSRNTANDLPPRTTAKRSCASPESPSGEWHHYGNTTHGTRYARLDQIDAANVGGLKEIWHYRTGRTGAFKATPLQIGDLLYVCTAMQRHRRARCRNRREALGVRSAGEGRRRSASTDVSRRELLPRAGRLHRRLPRAHHHGHDRRAPVRCRCEDRRSAAATSAATAKSNLLTGIGEVKPDFYLVTSPPTDRAQSRSHRQRVMDNFEVDEPSGVVRAYDVLTGKFAWAWDMGRPGVNTEPAEGEQYTRGTPNVWTLMSYDDALGLIYVPTGNSTPDYFGAHRSRSVREVCELGRRARRRRTARCAGRSRPCITTSGTTTCRRSRRWSTCRRPTAAIVPALVQATKRGELFLLDRRTGTPIAEVRGAAGAAGRGAETSGLAKTQPFSVGMPQFRGPISPKRTCGASRRSIRCGAASSSASCATKVTSRRRRSNGTLSFPGNAGGFNWGSVAIDEENQLLVVNPLIMGNRLAAVSARPGAEGRAR